MAGFKSSQSEKHPLPDAIFCINDPTAIEVMQILKVRGLEIPEDIALVGFSDDPASSRDHRSQRWPKWTRHKR